MHDVRYPRPRSPGVFEGASLGLLIMAVGAIFVLVGVFLWSAS